MTPYQAWPRRRDPTRFYHSLLILSCISNPNPILAHFPIHMYDTKGEKRDGASEQHMKKEELKGETVEMKHCK